MIHFLSLCGRHDERSRRCRAGDIRIIVNAFPQQGRKRFGAVNVLVTVDESGNVTSASAVSGHPLLRQAAEQAARASNFLPTLLSGKPVKVTGVIVYNFAPQ